MIGSSFSVSASSAASAVQRSNAAVTSSATATAEPQRGVLSFLTADDRELIASATGVTITAEGRNSNGAELAPALAWMIADDRMSGRLPQGQPITTAYLHRFTSEGAEPSFASAVAKMIEEVGKRQGAERLDLRA